MREATFDFDVKGCNKLGVALEEPTRLYVLVGWEDFYQVAFWAYENGQDEKPTGIVEVYIHRETNKIIGCCGRGLVTIAVDGYKDCLEKVFRDKHHHTIWDIRPYEDVCAYLRTAQERFKGMTDFQNAFKHYLLGA